MQDLLEQPLHLSRRRQPALDVIPDLLGALEREREIGGRPARLPFDEGKAQVFERGHGLGERFARVAPGPQCFRPGLESLEQAGELPRLAPLPLWQGFIGRQRRASQHQLGPLDRGQGRAGGRLEA